MTNNLACDALIGEGEVPDQAVPLRAFAVLEEYENTGGIIYAKTNVEARRIGANEYADGEFNGVSCKRAYWADEYVGKALPIGVMIEHGWNFECGNCGTRIDEDYLNETDRLSDDVVGHQYSLCFCDAVCEARYQLDKVEKERHGKRWQRRFLKIVRRRFPDVAPKPGHFYVSRTSDGKLSLRQMSVHFDFPGRQHGEASLRWDRDSSWKSEKKKPYWTCCAGDREVFEAYAASSRAPSPTSPAQGD